MNSKTITGGVLAGIVSFLLGWLIFGILLMDYYQSNMKSYEGLMRTDMQLWAIALANISFGIMLAYVLNLAGIKNPRQGFITAAIVGFLVSLSFNLYLYAQFNLYSGSLLVFDVIVNALLAGVIGAFLGWWFGRAKQKA